jgi:Holliday junction resolvase
MGKSQRDKGARGERELAKLTGGLKIPQSGAAEGFTNDVVLPNGWKCEVKRRKSGFKTLYEWVEDEREKPDVIALRTDRKQWLVTMTLDKFMELIGNERK